MNFHGYENAKSRTKLHVLWPPEMALVDVHGLTLDLKEMHLHTTPNLLMSRRISVKHLFCKNFSILKGTVISKIHCP